MSWIETGCSQAKHGVGFYSSTGRHNRPHKPVGESLLCDWFASMRFCPGHEELIASSKAAIPVQVHRAQTGQSLFNISSSGEENAGGEKVIKILKRTSPPLKAQKLGWAEVKP